MPRPLLNAVLTLVVATLTQSTAKGQRVHFGRPFVALGHPVGNGQMELTFYRENKALKNALDLVSSPNASPI
jgi:hypothetical protein